jgi:hypothetical protein
MDYKGLTMGYFVKLNGEFVGNQHKLVSNKEKAKFWHHPSQAKNSVLKQYENGKRGTWIVYTWVTEEETWTFSGH